MINIRDDFPILQRTFRERPLIYLDSAATTQKPGKVIEAMKAYYEMHNANVHRAAHILALEATELMENTRKALHTFINASDPAEIVYTRGTTEAINLLAAILGAAGKVAPGDEILITEMEHHSNIVPWQMLAERTQATLRAVQINDAGDLDYDDFLRKLNLKTRIFACNHVSNALGTVNPLAQLIADAKAAGVITVIDGAQAPLHQHIDVQALDCDFYCFSGHKMFGPTGIGVLYGKLDHLKNLPPWQGGGEMIERVTLARSTYQQPPYKFEAGTPHIAGAVGLGAAVEYINNLDKPTLLKSENELINRTISGLKQIPGVKIIGTPETRSSVVSFLTKQGHPHDLGTLLDQQGIAVRTGHHCAMPLMERLGIPGTVRASFSLYSNTDDVDRLLEGVDKAIDLL